MNKQTIEEKKFKQKQPVPFKEVWKRCEEWERKRMEKLIMDYIEQGGMD